jgi:hypothetical protein
VNAIDFNPGDSQDLAAGDVSKEEFRFEQSSRTRIVAHDLPNGAIPDAPRSASP